MHSWDHRVPLSFTKRRGSLHNPMRAQSTLIFSGFSSDWSEGVQMAEQTHFSGKCGLFNSCQIPGGNPTEEKPAFR